MTIEDTRRLGIEFERRVQTMIPEKEFGEKLDTDTIYSYLNQYQDKYVHEIYRNLDSIPSGSKLQSHVDSVLQPLLRSATIALTDNGVQDNVTSFSDDNGIEIIDSARSVVYPLPDDFYMYIKSVSRVSSTFSFRAGSIDNVNDGKIRVLPNTLLSQNDLLKVIETPHDSLRILRYPAASLTGGIVNNQYSRSITVIYDQYTTPVGIKVTYYKEPQHFDIMTSTPCELPIDAFEELVSGAVDLYVQYVAGAEARKRQIDEQRRQAAKEQEANNARRGRNSE